MMKQKRQLKVRNEILEICSFVEIILLKKMWVEKDIENNFAGDSYGELTKLFQKL